MDRHHPCAACEPLKGILCFQCYQRRAERRQRRKPHYFDGAQDERLQASLPLEPVDIPRLDRLRQERVAARAADSGGGGQYADRRRRAQIEARHALQRILAGVTLRPAPVSGQRAPAADALHAAELQLPDAWLPFVVSR